MKKIFILCATLLCVTGCSFNKTDSSKQVIKQCTTQLSGENPNYQYNAEYNIYSTNDTVDKIEINETLDSEDSDTQAYFESYIKDKYDEQNNNFGGVEYNIEKNDNNLEANTTIDYSKMDIEAYAASLEGMDKYVKDKKLLTEGMLEYYKLLGFTCE